MRTHRCKPGALLLAAFLWACGGARADDGAEAAADAAGSAPASPLRREADLGGHFTVQLRGAIDAAEESPEASFCSQDVIAGAFRMHVFTLLLFDAKYLVTISGRERIPVAGATYPFDSGLEGFRADLADMTHGRDASEWDRYENASGEVAFTEVTPVSVSGRYTFTARSSGGRRNDVTASGTFAAKRAASCL